MKRKILLAITAIFVFSGISCTKNSEAPIPFDNIPTESFSCRTDEFSTFTADSARYTTNGQKTFIVAYKGTNIRFEINLDGVTATTYPVAAGTNDFIYWPTSAGYSAGTNGTIVISRYDITENRITGSFGPIGTTGPGGTFTITEGYFTRIPKR
jgi:hypothetical protein